MGYRQMPAVAAWANIGAGHEIDRNKSGCQLCQRQKAEPLPRACRTKSFSSRQYGCKSSLRGCSQDRKISRFSDRMRIEQTKSVVFSMTWRWSRGRFELRSMAAWAI
jgi:hypothetical protein